MLGKKASPFKVCATLGCTETSNPNRVLWHTRENSQSPICVCFCCVSTQSEYKSSTGNLIGCGKITIVAARPPVCFPSLSVCFHQQSWTLTKCHWARHWTYEGLEHKNIPSITPQVKCTQFGGKSPLIDAWLLSPVLIILEGNPFTLSFSFQGPSPHSALSISLCAAVAPLVLCATELLFLGQRFLEPERSHWKWQSGSLNVL